MLGGMFLLPRDQYRRKVNEGRKSELWFAAISFDPAKVCLNDLDVGVEECFGTIWTPTTASPIGLVLGSDNEAEEVLADEMNAEFGWAWFHWTSLELLNRQPSNQGRENHGKIRLSSSSRSASAVSTLQFTKKW